MQPFHCDPYSLTPSNLKPEIRSQVVTKIKWRSRPVKIKHSQFVDVTLVSDDAKPFKAHKSILSIFSPAMKEILLKNPHPHPLIYLHGTYEQELTSLLQLFYFGELFAKEDRLILL